MALIIGPGLAAWIAAHQATPLGDETFFPPDFQVSGVPIQVADSNGKPVVTIVGWDKVSGAVLEPGSGTPRTTPSRIMYDAVNWQAIPADAEHVAGYIDGAQSQWPPEAWARFPHAARITVLGTQNADVADCETGDLTPQQAANWHHATGGIVYVDRSNLSQVLGLGVPISACWVADWTGQPHLYPGSWATQYANPPASGGDFDLSILGVAS